MIAIEKIVLIIIFLIVLSICVYILLGIATPAGQQIDVQGQIRQCCTLYRASGCPDPPNILCGDFTLTELINKISMTTNQLKAFCGC